MTHKRLLLVALAVALLVFPALTLAQDTSTFTYNGFGFSLPSSLATNVNVTQFAGDPTTLDQPGGPQPKYTEFLFYNGTPAPESLFDAVGGVRLFHTSDFNGYEFSARELQGLQTLLAQRPDLGTYMTADTSGNASNLPFVPVMPAAQVIRARAHYVDNGSLSGVAYVTVYRQDVSPFTANEFLYTFQGLSSDGTVYVSAIFKLSASVFPAEIPSDFDMDTFNANFAQYLSDSIGQLNNATADNFTPSLATLDSVIQSFSFGGAAVPPNAPVTAVPPVATLPPANAPTEAPTSSDPTLGGLGGVTWTLTAINDQPALPDRPVTLVFSQTGVSGSAGCNSFNGSFQYDGTNISFSQLVHTLMACEDAVNTQETAFLNALTTATWFELNGTQLQINYDGGVLTFTAAQ
jgi:heat shock protein HslJ